jgi:hypothetical protein
MSALALDVDQDDVLFFERLDAESARALTGRLRAALEVAHELLLEAYHGQAHTALGYRTWAEYCAGELADLQHTRLPRPQRRELVATLHTSGMSKRAIATGLGMDDSTVRADLKPLPGRVEVGEQLPQQLPEHAAVAALPPAPAPVLVELGRGTDRVLAVAAAAGAAGVTWRDVADALGWHHGQASGALSALHGQDRLVRLAERREGCAVYVRPDHAAGRPVLRPRQR